MARLKHIIPAFVLFISWIIAVQSGLQVISKTRIEICEKRIATIKPMKYMIPTTLFVLTHKKKVVGCLHSEKLSSCNPYAEMKVSGEVIETIFCYVENNEVAKIVSTGLLMTASALFILGIGMLFESLLV